MDFVDSPQAWVLSASCCVIYLVSAGCLRASGLLFVALMQEDNLSRGETSWPFSLVGVCNIASAPLVGYLSRLYSPTRISMVGSALLIVGHIPCFFSTNIYVISIFYGIVRGCGITFLCVIIPLVISTSFSRYRSTAMGISTSGPPLGGIVFPLLVQYFLNEYGLRGTFLMLAGVSMHAFAGSMAYMWYNQKGTFNLNKTTRNKRSQNIDDERAPLLKPLNPPESLSQCANASQEMPVSNQIDISRSKNRLQNSEEQTVGGSRETLRVLKKVFTNRGFYLITANQTICVCTNQIFMQVIIDYMADKGIPGSESVHLITSSAVGEIIGKLGLSWFTDRKLLSTQNHSALFLVASAATAIVIAYNTEFVILLVATLVFAACQGTVMSVNYVQFAEYTDKDELPLSMSFSRAISGSLFLTIPPIISLFRDVWVSYDKLFYCLAAVNVLMALVWMTESIVINLKIRRTTTTTPKMTIRQSP